MTRLATYFARDVDFDNVVEQYNLVVPPIPKIDDERRWCIVPWCRNDATSRQEICEPHSRMLARADWTVSDLISRELVKASRPGAGCANPACPTSEVLRPSRVPTSDRVRSFAPRRSWGQFQPGGEYLCRVCAALVNEIAVAFEPGTSPVEKAVEKVAIAARRSIPHATYEKLTGQILMRSTKRPASSLELADGFTLDQFVLGLEQYVGFWASVAEDRFRFRTEPDEVEPWLTRIVEVAAEAVDVGIAAGTLPNFAIPYSPGPIVLDAMLGRFPKGA